MSDTADLLEPASSSGRWLDAVTLSALQLIADALVELAGFEVAAIHVARDDGIFQTAVVAGDADARDRLVDRTTPIAELQAELEAGERWGRLTFLAAERRGRDAGHRGDAASPGDAWHPDDVLVALLHDESGSLRGLLSIDRPSDGTRPGPERRAVLERFAAQAERAVVSALERLRLVDQLRLVDATREVVRQASRSIDPHEVLERTSDAMVTAFDAVGGWLRLYHPDGESLVASSSTDHPVRSERGDSRLARRAAVKLWSRQQVGVVYPSELVNLDDDEGNRTVQRHMREAGLGSVMLVPLGLGEECLGSLTLARGRTAPRWTSTEMASALTLGSDLGQLLSNARAYEREQQVADELRALDAYKNQLIDTVTRELRRPLSAIVDDLEAIRDRSLPAYARQALDAMERTSGRMVRLVEDLMLLSRVVDPENPLRPGPVDLAGIVRDVSELSQAAIRERDLSLRVRAPAFQPVLALGDPAELDRVVVNLVSNAVKYTRDGGTVTITLRDLVDESGSAMVELVVADDGIGISEEDQERLFGEFFRSTNPAALVQPGTGLGLAIVDRIVRRHGGRIEVDSTLGAGASFRVLLPAAG